MIEVLVALAIFALLATLTGPSIHQALAVQKRLRQQSVRLTQINLAIRFLNQDTRQIILRAPRNGERQRAPLFTGLEDQVEFTRDGLSPSTEEKRSQLLRVAYLCTEGTLTRRTWDVLDTPNPEHYHDQVLLKFVDSCQWAYLSKRQQSYPEWHITANTHKTSPLPRAIQLNIHLQGQGALSFLFPLNAGSV